MEKNWTEIAHFCWQGRHPECDEEADRLAELECRPYDEEDPT